MSKTKPGIGGVHDPQHLFHGTLRKRHRALILPRYLDEAAHQANFSDAQRSRAREIILKWADMESKGQLARKETALDAQFLAEVFGEALGYAGATEHPERYHRERQFAVPGCGTADGALGFFPPATPDNAHVIIELKDAETDLDYDAPGGRTPVQQCWDYLNNLPRCPWGIVSNFVSFRLYHRDGTQQAFEHFTLQQLRDEDAFKRFYTLLRREGLLPQAFSKTSLALDLLERSRNRQREVGDKLYEYYSEQRAQLIACLIHEHHKTPDEAIRAAQKLLDRIIFIAFCEDRGLLPAKLIQRTWTNVPPLARATNPRWRAFLDVFYAVDKGHADLDLPTGYNGGLFEEDDNVDKLNLEDRWTTIFNEIGSYDFADDINVDVLGHFFEKSITELEKLRASGVFALVAAAPNAQPKMPKSAQRKRFGVYYTPPDFTTFIVEKTVGAVVDERFAALAQKHGVDLAAPPARAPEAKQAAFYEDCLAALRQLTVCDPACGSGAFLIQAYDYLEDRYRSVVESLAFHGGRKIDELARSIPDLILRENLYGVDLSKDAVEITQLALWIRSARKNRPLTDLSDNIVCGNSLVADAAVHPQAMKWAEKFPGIFGREDAGFDCVVGNPPWERMKLQEREFFSFSAADIAEAVNAAERRKLVAKLEKQQPALWMEYNNAKAQAERNLDYVRRCGDYPLTGKGDVNTYMVFAELARRIVRPSGRVGLLVPSGIATDDTTKEFFTSLMETQTLVALHDFENKAGVFADVHRSFKFSILLMNGAARKANEADFTFFSHDIRDLDNKQRHICLSNKDLALLNPNTRTCPIFRTRRDAELTKGIYRRVPILIDENRKAGGNPWAIQFVRMFDQTNDAELFQTADDLKKEGARPDGSRWRKGKKVWLPLYEAKMVQAYDHRAASVVIDRQNWVRQGQTEQTTLVDHQNPEFFALPRWWVAEEAVVERMAGQKRDAFLCIKDVTSPTNQRTMIAGFIPWSGVVNSAPLMLTTNGISSRRGACLLANLNTLAYDFVARQKVGGVHLNFFIVKQLPTLPPDAYDDKCPWNKRQTLETWISDRVLKLTCTSNDMLPLAKAAGFDEGVHKWKEAERAQLRAELDAAYFHLYGITREDAAYILSTFQGMTEDDGPQLSLTAPASLVLDAYDNLARS